MHSVALSLFSDSTNNAYELTLELENSLCQVFAQDLTEASSPATSHSATAVTTHRLGQLTASLTTYQASIATLGKSKPSTKDPQCLDLELRPSSRACMPMQALFLTLSTTDKLTIYS
jgi:hypothetical protein